MTFVVMLAVVLAACTCTARAGRGACRGQAGGRAPGRASPDSVAMRRLVVWLAILVLSARAEGQLRTSHPISRRTRA